MEPTTRYSPLTESSSETLLPHVKEHVGLLVETAQDLAVIGFDAQRRIAVWNPGAERLFGHAAAEIVGKPAGVLFTKEDRARHIDEQEFESVAETGLADDERWHLRKDGSRLFVSGMMTAMRDASGTLVGFTKIARDITPLKRAQEMLLEACRKAEAANAAKTEFLATITHEIRTPLNAILGICDILERNEPLTAAQKDYIATLHESAEFLIGLVNNLLDIATIETCSMKLDNTIFSLTDVVADVIKMMEPQARKKRLALTTESECIKGCMVHGDPMRVRQIIVNLCANALKFTKSGEVNIRITLQDSVREGLKNVCISVRDTGIGIAPEKLDSIFGRFVQADSSTSRKYGGSGLGLAITKHLTELMGGTITVDSAVGKGSTFTVCLPLPVAGPESQKIKFSR